MDRLLFLAKDIESAQAFLSQATEEAGLTESNVHTVTKDSVDSGELPEAGVVHTRDVVPALIKGLSIGAGSGLVVGVVLWLVPLVTFARPAMLVGILAVVGALVGMFAAVLIGVSVVKPPLRQFQESIAKGRVLLMIDVLRRKQRREVRGLATHHPDVSYEGRVA